MTIPFALCEWARRWGVPEPCLADLAKCMGIGVVPPEPPIPAPPQATEAWSQSMVRLEAPRFGIWLGRNNVGALLDKRGVPVRFGLANESKQQNEVMKSGDLIGIRPVVVTASMVGCTIGQFVSRECRGDAHETAQANWAALVIKYGGDAKFATGEGSFN